MHRRDLIKLLGSLLLCSGGSVRRADEGTGQPVAGRRRTVVIGAGLAGLAAARELSRSGHEVVVLEARVRIGGRVWTSQRWPDLPLDLGATWIHGVRGNPITSLADEIQARRLVTSHDRSATFDATGRRLTDAGEARLEEVRTQVRRALRHAQGEDPDVSVRQAVASLVRRLEASPEAIRLLHFVLSSDLEHEYAGGVDRLSAHWHDGAQSFGGGDALFARGFRVIADHLAAGLQVELSQVVREIHWGRPEVRVVTERAEFAAERVVVTLPLGVLQGNGVSFAPGLPPEKRNALAKLGMGVLNKCYLRFDEAFWPGDVDWVGHVAARHGEWTQWVSFTRVAGVPVLLGFNAASRGLEMEAWPDEQVVASAMETLRALWGDGLPQPTGSQVTRWASDPFARGAYSYNALGSTPPMRDALAAPLGGRLFFAGEACHRDHFGTTHGAYQSGLRAARDVRSA